MLGAQSLAGQVPCRGQRIDAITVDAQAPTVVGLRKVPLVGKVVRETHAITRDDVIRRFLLLHVGDRCSELRRAESERILRAQPFIADASIEALSNRRGGVTLEVKTIDEASLILSGSVAAASPAVRGVKVGSGNIGGLGIASSFTWGYQPVLEDRLDIRAADYQFLGRPYVLSLARIRDPLGSDDHAELTLPFRTDVQRYGWRTRIGESRGNAQFVKRDSGRLTLGYGRRYGEVGAIGRIGPPGKLSLFGLSFSDERSSPDTAPRRLDDAGFHPDTAADLAGRFMPLRASRVNALLGLRGIRFMRVRAFDALRATQDVPIGLQVGTLIGRGMKSLGADTSDLFVASDLYVGMGTPRLTYRLQLQGEGRRRKGSKDWDGLVGSGRLAQYYRPSDIHTRVLSVEWSGTASVLVPHALTLGVPDGGIRGFRNSTVVGGRRGIARIDEQFYIGSPYSFGDLGLAWFADAGQLWAGDLPYGESTRLHSAVGVSLLLAVPMRSKRMWRLEFAAPLNHERGTGGGGDRWEIRLSHSDRTSFFWREPSDVDGARARAVPASIYNWP